ncbi:hypothetical protein BYT27DRAFT_7226282 [Phlegmacium glaucopus]|nr:hypothetical protein BYT27DRAFT_7226282 [Phlegmacium glaucopus]
MLHFPSKLQTNSPNGAPRRSDLNATQHKTASHPIFSQVEEELHDARRVHSHGQEEDLRSALIMVINRVSELSSLLNDAYKAKADLEVELNVAKSNLKLVIANNEMLEDALKRDSGQSKDVGWRRTSARDGEPRSQRGSLDRSTSADYAPLPTELSPTNSGTPPQSSDNRFFKFRFSSASPSTRPGTPTQGITAHHLNSPSMPSLSSLRMKEVEELTAELEKERVARKTIADEKAALENELESLSQALFEEANNMVATERKMRAETEEELKELRQEKEALRSALRLIDGENTTLRERPNLSPSKEKQIAEMIDSFSPPPSRSSSRMAVKSRPASLDLYSILPPLPPSPFSSRSSSDENSHPTLTEVPPVLSPEEESQPTPKFLRSMLRMTETQDDMFMGPSPWADVTSTPVSQPKYSPAAYTTPR